MNEWRPIATAPIDGKSVLAFDSSRGFSEPFVAYYDWVKEAWCDRCDGEPVKPDWWIPMPHRPSLQGASE